MWISARRQSMQGVALLALTALIWGSAFVAQRVGMDSVGPLTFNAVRSILGGVTLLPVLWLRRGKTPPQDRRTLLIGGALCGLLLAAGSALQQYGIARTSVGKAGFLTALYILLVPLFGLLRGKRGRLSLWCGVALAVVGLYLLCRPEQTGFSTGDLLVLCCAVVFALHILVIDRFSPRCDGVALSCIQFFVCGLLSALPALIFEHPAPAQVQAAWLPLLYAGVLSIGVGYTLQVVAQKWVEPTAASLVLSLESVFAALSGWLLLHQAMSARELAGCALVFAAILLAQLPGKREARG